MSALTFGSHQTHFETTAHTHVGMYSNKRARVNESLKPPMTPVEYAAQFIRVDIAMDSYAVYVKNKIGHSEHTLHTAVSMKEVADGALYDVEDEEDEVRNSFVIFTLLPKTQLCLDPETPFLSILHRIDGFCPRWCTVHSLRKYGPQPRPSRRTRSRRCAFRGSWNGSARTFVSKRSTRNMPCSKSRIHAARNGRRGCGVRTTGRLQRLTPTLRRWLRRWSESWVNEPSS